MHSVHYYCCPAPDSDKNLKDAQGTGVTLRPASYFEVVLHVPDLRSPCAFPMSGACWCRPKDSLEAWPQRQDK